MAPLYRQIMERILDDIKDTLPDSRIPSRLLFMKKFRVTRTTIDRAIAELIANGVLYAIDGSGTYVAPKNEKTRVLTTKRPIWGAIIPNITQSHFARIVRAIEDIAVQNNIDVIVCNSDNYNQKQSQYIENLLAQNVQGFIIVPASRGDLDVVPFLELKQRGIPYVFCSHGIEGLDSPMVISGNIGFYWATRHLVDCGYKKIGFVSRPLSSIIMRRYEGYVSALTEAGLPLNKNYVRVDVDFDKPHPGYESVKKLLELPDPIDAVFCHNDIIAQGAYDAITGKGLRVGKDIGLIGYNDAMEAPSIADILTTVRIKSYECGKESANMLLKLMINKGKISNHIEIILPELIVRKSTCKKQL